MSFTKRQKDASKAPRKPAAKAAKNWVTKPLTNPQKAQLSIAARAAFELQQEHGLTGDLKYDEWRREQTEIACGKDSFRDCTNREFRSILARFLQLAGKDAEAAALWSKTGRVDGSAELNDTHENRETAIDVINRMIERSNGRIDMNYVMHIAKDQHEGNELIDIPASGLQSLVYTLTNRLSDKGMDMSEL